MKKFDLILSIFAVIASRSIRLCDAYPMELSEIEDDISDNLFTPSWNIDDILDRNDGTDNSLRRAQILHNLQKVLGIPGEFEKKSNPKKTTPKFMMELYKTITDSSGNARGKNLYDAKIVRSFMERDTILSHLYVFNVSGLEINESVLEAELHLYRKLRISNEAIDLTVLTSPYYLIRVYQVLEDKSVTEPDLHRLLSVHYVGAHDYGWQVFNVKQAVLSWLSGSPNLGLMVTASNIFDDEVTIEFSRREDDPDGDEQPILVLFNDDGKSPLSESEKTVSSSSSPKTETDNVDDDIDLEDKKREGKSEDSVDVKNGSMVGPAKEISLRRKRDSMWRNGDDEKMATRKFVTERRKGTSDILTSMDIYERAMLREKMAANYQKRKRGKRSSFIDDSTSGKKIAMKIQSNSTKCSRHELYVDFDDIGLSSWIIAPPGYLAYQCQGHCNSLWREDGNVSITNHAIVQGVIHNLGLGGDVNMPCCVPTKLRNLSVLFVDTNMSVVLKNYSDMIVDTCGCR